MCFGLILKLVAKYCVPREDDTGNPEQEPQNKAQQQAPRATLLHAHWNRRYKHRKDAQKNISTSAHLNLLFSFKYLFIYLYFKIFQEKLEII